MRLEIEKVNLARRMLRRHATKAAIAQKLGLTLPELDEHWAVIRRSSRRPRKFPPWVCLPAEQQPSAQERQKQLQAMMRQALDEHGVNFERLAKTHRQALAARRPVVLDGEIKKVPDHPTRLAAVKLGYEVWGLDEKQEQRPGEVQFGPRVVFQVSPEEKAKIEQMTGVPLPVLEVEDDQRRIDRPAETEAGAP